jgi:hypothetical protein
MNLHKFASELLSRYNSAQDGQIITGQIINDGTVFYVFTKTSGCVYFYIVSGDNPDHEYRIPHYCFEYLNDKDYSCSNPSCPICSFKVFPASKIFIDGQFTVPKFLFDRLTLPTNITIIDNRFTKYFNVKEIIIGQHTFKFKCTEVDSIGRWENHSEKKFVEKVWVRTIDLCMLKMYNNLREAVVIDPKFKITTY